MPPEKTNNTRSHMYHGLLPLPINLGMYRHTMAHCTLKSSQALLVPPLPLCLDLISLQSKSLVIGASSSVQSSLTRSNDDTTSNTHERVFLEALRPFLHPGSHRGHRLAPLGQHPAGFAGRWTVAPTRCSAPAVCC